MHETQVAAGHLRGMAADTEGCTLVSRPSLPSLVHQPGALKVSSWFTQCRSNLSYEWLLLLLAKAAVDNTGGKNWLGSKQTELQRERTWTWNISNWQHWAVVSCPQGRHLEKATASQPPLATGRASAPGCKQLLTLSPNRGSFLRLFSWYLAVWMLIPLTKLSPMLFPPSFSLIFFSQWKKKKRRGGGKENTSQPSLAAPGFALILPLSFMLPTGISIWL